jgi:hypothetical protein
MVTLQIDAVKTDEGISLRPHADLVAGRGIDLVLDAGPSDPVRRTCSSRVPMARA